MQTETTLERLQLLLPDVFNPKPQTGDLYLRFCITPSIYAAVPITRVRETLRLPTKSITPIPNMPAHTLGLMENRNKVFWVLDLAQQLALTQNPQRVRHHNVIVVELLAMAHQGAASLLLGLSVQQIQTTVRLNPGALTFNPDGIRPELQPYFQGCFQADDEQTILFNIDAMVNAD